MTPTKKLIEVALPLDEINSACKADKDRKTGTIRNLHKWFAPMPLPAWRALLWAALIDDPADAEKRAYLLDVLKRLVANGADLPDADVLAEARALLLAQFPAGLPPVLDPFCGGGSTLVEAQRLGLETLGSDLNPVPVLITRVLTELLPSVYGTPPLHPLRDDLVRRGADGDSLRLDGYVGSFRLAHDGLEGLVQDVAHYGSLVKAASEGRLADRFHHEAGERPIAWLWARTIPCPNPACEIETVLTTSWWLSKKQGDMAWIVPEVSNGEVSLPVSSGQVRGEAPESPKVGRGSSFKCLACGQTITDDHISAYGKANGLGLRMTAVVAEVGGRRIYREARREDLLAASQPFDSDRLAVLPLGDANQYTAPPRFGITSQLDLYSTRQLAVLSTFAEEIAAVPEQVLADGGSAEYARAVGSMLVLALGRLAQNNSSLVSWRQRSAAHAKAESAFGRADFPMLWDFAETYFDGGSVGDWSKTVDSVSRSLAFITRGSGRAVRQDARQVALSAPGLVATDPPYFDAIPYADLSDYFYLWHRYAGRAMHPDLYATTAAPKTGELTAFPWHHGGTRDAAKKYFVEGFTEVFSSLKRSMLPGLPLLVVYASKEQHAGIGEETRWSAILSALLAARFEIVATWPIHGTGSTRMRSQSSNAVATYVVMVCRPRPDTAGSCSLADFNRSLRRELKAAVHDLQAAGIMPVDLAQAAMGPGMQIYSRYREVIDQTGDAVPVEQALRLINAALGEVLDEQEGELDPDSRFAVAWWEKHGWDSAAFGEADQLARPQGISVDDVVRAGVATYPKAGFVSLVGNKDMNRDWLPSNDTRPTAWEAVHHLADRLIDGGGVVEAGRLMGQLGLLRDPAQALVYRLHAIAARKGRTKDQERYNALIGSWSDLLAIAASEKDGLF